MTERIERQPCKGLRVLAVEDKVVLRVFSADESVIDYEVTGKQLWLLKQDIEAYVVKSER